MRRLALAFVLAGCRLSFEEVAPGDAFVDPTPPEDFTSGTRLRAIVFDSASDRSLARTGWFDTVLGEECDVRRGDDGTTYCFPNRAGAFAQFADPACTVPLMRMRAPMDVASCPSMAQLGYVETFPRSEVFRLGRVGALYTGTVYQNAGGPTCDVLTATGLELYSVAEYLPLTDLVAFTEEVVPAGPLGYIRTHSADGASELDALRLVDMATGERCRVSSRTHGEVNCDSESIPDGSLAYVDAACTERAVVTYQQPEAPVVRAYEPDKCGYVARHASIGTELTTYYVRDAGTCTLRQTSMTGTRAWAVTELGVSAPMASGTLVVAGTGPIARGRWQFTTGHSLPSLLVDRTRNDDCYPIQVRDTLELVCAPIWSGPGARLFSDAACTVDTAVYPTCAGPWRSTWYPTAPFQETCTGVAYIVRPNDLPQAGPFYWFDDGACTPVPADISVYSQSSAEYPTSSMVSLTRRRE